MSNPTGPEVGPLQVNQTRWTDPTPEQQAAALRAQIYEAAQRTTKLADGTVIPDPGNQAQVAAMVDAYKALTGDAPDAPLVLNVGGGKVAFVDPKTQKVTVVDAAGLTPEQKKLADDQAAADIAYKQALADKTRADIRTPEEIAAGVGRDTAAANASNASANASNASAWANSPAGIRARAQAEADATVAAAIAKVGAGVEMKEEDRIKLQNDLKMIADKAAADIKSAQDKEAFDRNQPNVDRTASQNQQQLDQAAAYQQGQLAAQQAAETRQRTVEQTKPLLEQSQSMDSLLRDSAKAGVAPVAGAVGLVFNPLNAAQQKLAALEQSGQVPPQFLPSWLPKTGGAPAPTGARPAAAPAPTPAPTTAPAPGSLKTLTGGMA